MYGNVKFLVNAFLGNSSEKVLYIYLVGVSKFALFPCNVTTIDSLKLTLYNGKVRNEAIQKEGKHTIFTVYTVFN